MRLESIDKTVTLPLPDLNVRQERLCQVVHHVTQDGTIYTYVAASAPRRWRLEYSWSAIPRETVYDLYSMLHATTPDIPDKYLLVDHNNVSWTVESVSNYNSTTLRRAKGCMSDPDYRQEAASLSLQFEGDKNA